jgi:putative PIN family toxin of toxin-antitoxin system
VLVSGMLARGGVPSQVVDLAIRGHFLNVTSRPLLDELARVLQYPKLASVFQDPLGVVLVVQQMSILVEPHLEVDLLDDDNRLLEAALVAQADYIVTGDKGPLDLRSCNGTQIVTPRAFLVAIGGLGLRLG